MSTDLNHHVYTDPFKLLEWTTTQAPLLRKGLGQHLIGSRFNPQTDVMMTKEGAWAHYNAAAMVIASPVFLEEQARYERERLDLHFVMRMGLKVPGISIPTLPLEGNLEIPVGKLPTVHIDLCLKRIN